jgi:hypothetical protein
VGLGMPKPLLRPQPTSSVANILDESVARAALARVTPARRVEETEQAAHTTSVVADEALTETPTIRRQFILTPSADLTLKHMVALYSKATGSELTNSHVLRALLKAIEHAMPQLEHEAEQMGKLKRPKNDRANEAHRDEFERKLASCIVAGMNGAPDMA